VDRLAAALALLPVLVPRLVRLGIVFVLRPVFPRVVMFSAPALFLARNMTPGAPFFPCGLVLLHVAVGVSLRVEIKPRHAHLLEGSRSHVALVAELAAVSVLLLEVA